MKNGCYADGRIFAISTKHGATDERYEGLMALVEKAKIGSAVRLNVSGDFLNDQELPDQPYIDACNALAALRPDLCFISYTHAWRQLSPADFGFTVNASCETPADVAEAISKGWQTVMVDDGTAIGTKVAGRNVVQCPQQYREAVTCDTCRACSIDTRTRPVIAFLIHGATRGKARKTLIQQRKDTA